MMIYSISHKIVLNMSKEMKSRVIKMLSEIKNKLDYLSRYELECIALCLNSKKVKWLKDLNKFWESAFLHKQVWDIENQKLL